MFCLLGWLSVRLRVGVGDFRMGMCLRLIFGIARFEVELNFVFLTHRC